MHTPHESVPLPERTKSHVSVLWGQATRETRLLCHVHRVVGRYMHWGDRHSELCLLPEQPCPHCADGKKRLWYGWLFGRNDISGGAALLQLTLTAVRSNLSLSDPNCDLRGAKIELFRQADRTGSLVTAKVHLSRNPDRFTKDEPDVLEHLFRFYRLPLYRSAAIAADQDGAL